jgi:protein SCO1/2
MNRKTSEILRISALLVVFIVGVVWGYFLLRPKHALPILAPADLNPAVVADSLEGVGMDHRIGDWTLTDQTGTLRTAKDVKGRVVVANFFFTTCQSICVDMAKNMRLVQSAYASEDRVQLLSHSVMPEVDSVPVLNEYARANGVDAKRWWLLTGPTSEINRLARTKYFAVMEAGQTWDEHSFIHTENVALIDGEGRVRGYYDGTNPDQIRLLIKHVGWLLEEYDE